MTEWPSCISAVVTDLHAYYDHEETDRSCAADYRNCDVREASSHGTDRLCLADLAFCTPLKVQTG